MNTRREKAAMHLKFRREGMYTSQQIRQVLHRLGFLLHKDFGYEAVVYDEVESTWTSIAATS